MITITDQNEMIEIGHTFLHQETNLSQDEVLEMEDFDVYYETREMVKEWNELPEDQLANKELGLEEDEGEMRIDPTQLERLNQPEE